MSKYERKIDEIERFQYFEFFRMDKFVPEKSVNAVSIEETLGYHTVSTVLCANSD